jgi:glutamate synthase domain-containing protein 3
MSGGQVFVLDPGAIRVGPTEMVPAPVEPDSMAAKRLHVILELHLLETGSPLVRALFADWDAALVRFARYAPAAEQLTSEPHPLLEPRPQVSSP